VRGDRARLADMLERIDKVLAHTPPHPPAVSDESWTLDAVVRNLEVIGEAARQISPGVRRRHADIPWRAMSGFRVLATHVYWEVEPERVWVIVRQLPGLRRQLARIQVAE
jgi:uncharacterized protein with HEPN domain